MLVINNALKEEPTTRRPIPMLNNQLTKEEFLQLIPDCFQSVIFGTVDAAGNPHTTVADIELLDQGKLIFATTYQKAFYQRLINHPRIALTALRGEETMTSVGFSLTGTVQGTDRQYLDQIFAQHPEMNRISSENPTERQSLLRPMAITPLQGSVYDLRQSPIFQKQFQF